MELDCKIYEDKMKKSISVYESELGLVRAGRANPSILNGVTVDYYGTPTPINQIGEVKLGDARTIVVAPWDASMLRNIEKAILVADVGAVPQNDGKVIRLTFQPLTEDRRKELSKQVQKMGEDAKVNIRNIRRDANDKSHDMKKASEMTEDEEKKSVKKIQDLTDKYIKQIDTITENKIKEVMAI